MEWMAFFAGLAASMLLGFLAMAHPGRSAFVEVAAFCIAAVAGLLVGTAILLMAPSGSEVYLLTVFSTCLGTLATAVPRMLWQSLRAEHITIGMLFRMTAYVALLVVVGSRVERQEAIRQLSAGIVVAAGAFYLIWGYARRLHSRDAWLLAVPMIYGVTLAFSAVIFASIHEWAELPFVWQPPWSWNRKIWQVGYGAAVFTVIITQIALARSIPVKSQDAAA